MRKIELLEPGELYEYTIDIWRTIITLEEGYRPRAEITSVWFPHFPRNLDTGGHNELETDFIKATQRIYHSPEYQSHLFLPVVDPG